MNQPADVARWRCFRADNKTKSELREHGIAASYLYLLSKAAVRATTLPCVAYQADI